MSKALQQWANIRELANNPVNVQASLAKIFSLADAAAKRAANESRSYNNSPTDVAADMLMVADNLSTVLTVTTNSPLQFTWQFTGLVIYLSVGSKEATAASLACLELGIRINGNEDLIVNGTGGGGTIPFSALCPQNAPMRRLVDAYRRGIFGPSPARTPAAAP